AAPNSYTGEDSVELQGHGGPVVMQMLLSAVLAAGARLARPGEFSERAFLNGQMDLAQAEAVADLIASASTQAARGAVRSLSGEFSSHINQLDADILKLRVSVEATIDFPDEEVEFLAEGRVGEQIEALIGAVQALTQRGRQGALLTQGVSIAIIGAPNAGKSSLLNRLSGEEAAIVTDIPGTTRDLLKVDLVLDGLPIRMVDTAGLRDTADPVEVEGVRRARLAAEQADLILEVFDLAVTQVKAEPSSPERTLRVENKIDLVNVPPGLVKDSPSTVRVSCLTGDGIEALKGAIKQRVGFTGEGSTFSARQRHIEALNAALSALENAAQRLEDNAAAEVIAEELRLAHLALGEITGETTPDDLLGSIFATFCIGK
ncbi:MAG: tRNA uridine-5-carboxymethylaminomethyl(34) synthesis GTPase MnmE, partial [Gammaproteobacteria bacterium]|nr:tRNA uridine-5-carboxymethylaminomethyl(34) synthesis GTPase MnmE [Gammaproteobacteria bacterium]